ncbi:MAG: 30S ribosomal protein S6 [Bdellovibrionales bacterium]|nr:30S ribosomal protein S6 [Bdellovibrionales bacterium]
MNYESVLVMDPSLSKEEQKKTLQKIREIIQQFKGRVYHIDTWGVRKLANKNRKNWSQGLYFHFSFAGESGVVEELVRIIRMDEKLLYYHFEKLSSQKSPAEHLDDFRSLVEEAIKKEKERQVRIQKRKSFLSKKVM